jgi:hypothetical protein
MRGEDSYQVEKADCVLDGVEKVSEAKERGRLTMRVMRWLWALSIFWKDDFVL